MLKSLLIPKNRPFRLLLLGSASCAVVMIFVFSPEVFILSASSDGVSKYLICTQRQHLRRVFSLPSIQCASLGTSLPLLVCRTSTGLGKARAGPGALQRGSWGAQGLCCLCVGSDSVLCAEDGGVEEASICSLYSLLC